jgi:hypothetical protein
VPLLFQRPVTAELLPDFSGEEVLVGPDPEICKVKGVMFGGRKTFVLETFGEEGYYDSLVGLSPRTLNYARNPIATMWCEFGALVEYDKSIHERWHARYPHVLALLGASSAELGIGTVYRSLDSEELLKFLEKIALFHEKYQKYGRLTFEATPGGARMTYLDYPCYSRTFCASGIGFFMESILRHGGTNPSVKETRCHCWGDKRCTYELQWR